MKGGFWRVRQVLAYVRSYDCHHTLVVTERGAANGQVIASHRIIGSATHRRMQRICRGLEAGRDGEAPGVSPP